MNPVIGLDVAKGESKGQVFLAKGKPYGKTFSLIHTTGGFNQFNRLIKEIEEVAGATPTVILESTGHYHASITQFLDEHNYVYILLNPLIAHEAKKSSSLRRVKTDSMDAYRLCELFYKEDFEPYKQRSIRFLNLRSLTRQHDAITKLSVQTKLQFQALLDQVFPEYVGVFGALYSNVSLNTLLEFPTAQAVLSVSETHMAERIKSLCKSRSKRWSEERAQQIMMAASRNPFRNALVESHVFSLQMLIKIILQYTEHLSNLEKQIDALAEEFEEYKIVQSIPGIGEKIAATIISEIGGIDRFNHAKKLVAFVGVDPSVHSSGKFTATINRITKHGSSRLRHALYEAVSCGLRKSGCEKLKAYYAKKKDEGKPYKVIMVACINKLVHWIYALLTRKETFLDLA